MNLDLKNGIGCLRYAQFYLRLADMFLEDYRVSVTKTLTREEIQKEIDRLVELYDKTS